ncbi:Ankyrin repeat domain-containing protein 17 [Apiospora saccharicola]
MQTQELPRTPAEVLSLPPTPTEGAFELGEYDEEDECWTPLQLAAKDGDLATVEKLLREDGTDVNAPPAGYYGNTALQAACLFGHEAVVRKLIAAGADVEAPGGNNGRRNALQQACRSGNPSVVSYLLQECNANINAPALRYHGRTALQVAAEARDLKIVQLLLAAGADVNAKPAGTAGRTALTAAASVGDLEIVQLLLQPQHGADVNAPPSRHKGITALQAACCIGHEEIVKVLIEAGADVNAQGSSFKGAERCMRLLKRGT